MSETSFYTDGETYTDALVTSGDKPGSTTPSQAPSSMYPDGSVYDNLSLDLTNNAGIALPLMDATLASAGIATKWSREDHVHPTDTSRAPTANPVFTGLVTATGGGTFRAPIVSEVEGFVTPSPIILDGGQSTVQAQNTGLAWLFSNITYGVSGLTPGFGFAKTRGLSPSAHGALTNGDAIYGFFSYGDDGAALIPAASFGTFVDGAVSAGVMPVEISFWPGTGGYGTRSLRLRSSGVAEFVSNIASTSTTTGTVTVAGGVGIAGALNVGGVASGPTAAVDTNTTQLATTAYVLAQAGASNPLAAGTAAPGTSTRWSRQDHVHPTDTSRAPIASPNFTGDVGVAGRFINGGTGSTSLGYTQELHTDDTHTLSQQYHAVHVNWGTTTEYPAHRFFKSKSGTKGVHTAVSNNVGLGAIDWGGSDGTSFVIGAGIDGFCDGPVATGSVPARISFYTTAAGASVLEKMRLDSSGNLGVNGTAASGVRVHAYETATGSTAQIRAENTSASTGFAEVQAKADAGTNALGIQTNASGGVGYVGGTSSAISLAFYSNSLERMRIASSGGGVSFANGFGYGFYSGVGGTVTQATSKSTGVTLNKVTGTITMNAAALAAGTIVSFAMTNTTIAVGDVLVLNHVSGGTGGAYSLNAQCGAGTATINVRNNTASSLSEAVVIKFVLIKGANA